MPTTTERIGALRIAENLAGAVAFVEHQHAVADAGVDGGHGDEIAAGRFAGWVQAIDDQQPPIVVIGVVDRRDDFTGYLADEHVA